METKKINLYTYREHEPDHYQVLDPTGIDPIGEYLSKEQAEAYCKEANQLEISMQLLEIDEAEDFYVLISQFYANDQKKLAKALFDGIGKRHQDDCIAFLDVLFYWDAADNDEQPELAGMLAFLKGN